MTFQTFFLSLILEGEDFTLDCNGHSITGPGDWVAGNPYLKGVYAESVEGITITNCNINGFTMGINVLYGEASELISNTLTENHIGIRLGDSNSNTLTGNTANENFHGIELISSDSNAITGNEANGNGMNGISLSNSNSNTLTGNIANNNNNGDILGSGIILRRSSSNMITGNEANGNGKLGIFISTPISSSNTLTGNTANNNGQGGIGFHVVGTDNIITEQELVCSTP